MHIVAYQQPTLVRYLPAPEADHAVTQDMGPAPIREQRIHEQPVRMNGDSDHQFEVNNAHVSIPGNHESLTCAPYSLVSPTYNTPTIQYARPTDICPDPRIESARFTYVFPLSRFISVINSRVHHKHEPCFPIFKKFFI